MSESALLRAVATRIRSAATIGDNECDIEIDERAPSVSPDRYIIVTFGGVVAGPTHETAGGVIDKLYGVDIAIALRAPKKPRDRTREFWTGFRGTTALVADSFESTELTIQGLIDFDYDTINNANTLITAETGSTDGFIEPLKFASAGPLREAPREIFAGSGGDNVPVAFIRTIQYRGARRIEVRS